MARKTIELIARGALIHNGRLLLCRNRKHGHAFLPGGHVNFGEPAAEALLREVREELGIELATGDFLGAMEASFLQSKAPDTAAARPSKPSQQGPGRRHHEVNLVFELLPTTGAEFDTDALQSREKPIEFVWMPLADLIGDSPAVAVLPPGILSLIAPDHTWHSSWK